MYLYLQGIHLTSESTALSASGMAE